MAAGSNPELTWANIVGTLVFLVALISLAGTVIQNQINSVKEEVRIMERGLLRRDEEIKSDIKDIRSELLMRRQEFVTQFEFRQFSTSADDRWKTQAEINKQAIDAYLSTKAFEAWKSGREQISNEVSVRLRELERKQQSK